MCYRYSVPAPDQLVQRFNVSFPEKNIFQRRFHVASFDTPKLPVITDDKPDTIQLFTWGLIPYWVNDRQSAEKLRKKTMNARSEDIYEKSSFRQPARQRHCLVLIDGFFEWQEVAGKNYPYYIRLKNQKPFSLAGLWDTWKDTTRNELFHTYTVLTTKANQFMEHIHTTKKRMPVILSKENELQWLNIYEKQQLQQIFSSYPDEELEAYTISKVILSENPDIPEILKPWTYPELQQVQKL